MNIPEPAAAILRRAGAQGALLSGAAASLLALLLGPRGLGPTQLAHMEQVQLVLQALAGRAPWSATLQGGNPGVALLHGLLARAATWIAPGLELWRLLALTQALMSGLVAALVWTLARRALPAPGAALAVWLVATSSPWLNAATTGAATMTLAALRLATLALGTAQPPRARARRAAQLGFGLCAGLTLTSWPVAALWGAAALACQLADGQGHDQTPGVWSRPRQSLGWLLGLLSAPLWATLAHPGLWRPRAWLIWLDHALLTAPAGQLYRGAWLGQDRLPWYAGWDLLLWRAPAPLLALALMGAWGAWRREPAQARPLIAAALLTLVAPWWTTSTWAGHADLMLLSLPVASILAASALWRAWAVAHARHSALAARVGAALARSLVMLAGPWSAALAWPDLGSAAAPWRGGTPGAIAAGMSPSYDPVLPEALARRARERGCAVDLELRPLLTRPLDPDQRRTSAPCALRRRPDRDLAAGHHQPLYELTP